jgi:hypothetical protein
MPLLCKASPRLARGTRVGADLPNAPAAIAAHRPDPLLGAVHTGTGEHVPWEVFAIPSIDILRLLWCACSFTWRPVKHATMK